MQFILLAPIFKWLFCSLKAAIMKEGYFIGAGEDGRIGKIIEKELCFNPELFIKKHQLEWLENKNISQYAKLEKLQMPTTSSIRVPQLSAGLQMENYTM
jgi:hypothetical protein